MSDETARHGQIMEALGEIRGELHSLFPTVARQRVDHDRLEGRTRLLENWRWYLAGLFSITLLGSVLGFILR